MTTIEYRDLTGKPEPVLSPSQLAEMRARMGRPMNRTEAARTNARRDWYQIRNEADADGSGPVQGPVQVMIYGEIGDSWFSESVPASQFVRDMAAIDDDKAVDFHIHSPGGDVFDGLAIATAIRNHPGKTVAYVDGLAASAASYIAIAADETVMAVGAQAMVHDAWGLAMGNAADMQKMADDLGKVSDNIAQLYALKAGGSVEDWRSVMLAETWYTADEAVEAGLADRVDRTLEPEAAKKNAFNLSIFAHAGRQNAPAPRFPRRAQKPPAEPADPPHPMEGADMPMSDHLVSGLRERLGISAEAELTDSVIMAALDEALAERAEPTTQVPAGTVLIEASVLADLQANAAQGAAARAQQVAEQRGRIVDSAIADGRITPARRDHWLAALNADPEGAEQTLSGLAKGLVPVEPQGYTGGLAEASDDDRIYAAAFGKEA